MIDGPTIVCFHCGHEAWLIKSLSGVVLSELECAVCGRITGLRIEGWKVGVDQEEASALGYRAGVTKDVPLPGEEHTAVPKGMIAVFTPEGTPCFIVTDMWDAARKKGYRKR